MFCLTSPLSALGSLAVLLSGFAGLYGGLPIMSAVNTLPESAPSAAAEAAPKKLWVYIGTYTGGQSKGIYLFQLDLATGKMTPQGLAAEAVSPSFLAVHPNRKFLYAVNEVSEFAGQKGGAVSAFAMDPQTGHLTLLNQQSSGGDGPCHLIVDREGKNVLVANYGGGSVAVLPIQPNGSLGKASAFVQHHGSSVNPQRQEKPHAHSVRVDAANRFAFVADLGLDKIMIYRFDADKGTIVPNDVPAAAVAPGAGPRHFIFHPNGAAAYVINEMDSTVTVFDYDAHTGKLTPIQTLSTLPEDFRGTNYPAEVQVTPDGRFLYGSNRGHDSLAIFSIDAHTGRLTYVGDQSTLGKNPRNFGIDPTGTYLLAANQDSNSIHVFRIDPQTGKLHPTGQTVEAPKPVCVLFLPVAQR